MPLMRCLMWGDCAQDDNELLESFVDLFQHLRIFAQKNGLDVLSELEEAVLERPAGKTGLRDFIHVAGLLFWKRSICYTSKGYLAAAAPDAQVANNIAVVPGCSCPILLKRVDS